MNPAHREIVLQALESTGECQVRVLGASMKPSIRPNDIVTITQLTRPPRFGSIVAFFNGDQLIVHRIIGVEKTGTEKTAIVKGDSSRHSVARIRLSSIIGEVRAITRDGIARKVTHRLDWFVLPAIWTLTLLHFALKRLKPV